MDNIFLFLTLPRKTGIGCIEYNRFGDFSFCYDKAFCQPLKHFFVSVHIIYSSVYTEYLVKLTENIAGSVNRIYSSVYTEYLVKLTENIAGSVDRIYSPVYTEYTE